MILSGPFRGRVDGDGDGHGDGDGGGNGDVIDFTHLCDTAIGTR